MSGLNSRRFMKLYDCLGVWERIPLLLAAHGRNDEVERQRLFDTSPIRTWHFSEHFLADQALNVLALIYISEQLDAAGAYFFALMKLDDEAEPEPEDWLLIAQSNAYFFTANAAAWLRFCADLLIDAQTLTAANHRGWFLAYCEEQMPAHAPSASELTVQMQRHGRDATPLVTEERLLASWRRTLQAMTGHAPPPFAKEQS